MSLYTTIVAWYQQQKRLLPWRKHQDAYPIWVAEIMLQQTRIETVIPYYERFLSLFPTISSLASADDQLLLKAWQGLGYYSRVRNLKQAAMIIQDQHGGVFPLDYKVVLALPGIGEYTAAAILSIVNHAPYVCVDGNVLRVYARLFTYPHNVLLTASKKEVQQHLQSLLGPLSGDFNQGMMELGETICLPKNPKCALCPCHSFCQAYLNQQQDSFPVRVKVIKRESEEKTMVIVRYQQTIALRKRDESLLHQLYEPYTLPGKQSLTTLSSYFQVAESSLHFVGHFSHLFSHRKWLMHVYYIELSEPREMEGYTFYPIDTIEKEHPLPTAYYKWLAPYLK